VIDGYVVSQYTAECRDPFIKALTNFQNIEKSSSCFFSKKSDLLTMGIKLFTLLLFFVTTVRFIIALFMYVPLLMRIRGNLKEYCAHKIDKR
jgi:hypothetical protein